MEINNLLESSNGYKSLQADAELCVMISEILEKCGLAKSEYIVKISSRKITEELFKKIEIILFKWKETI